MIQRRLTLLQVALAATALTLTGCESDEPSRDQPSYRVVVNGTDGDWGAEPWSITVNWVVGGLEATEEYAFSGKGLTLAVGMNGQLLVADREAPSVRAYSRDGHFVRSIGRQGQGPGEWRAPRSIGVDGIGRIWVTDVTRYLVYDSAGVPLDTKRRPDLLGVLPQTVRSSAFSPEGHFLDEFSIYTGSGQSLFAVARVDTASSEVVDTILVYREPRPIIDEVAPGIWRASDPDAPPPPYLPYLAALVVDLGPDHAWIADSRALVLTKVSLEGDTLAVIRTTHRDNLTLSREGEKIIREALDRTGQDEAESAYGREVVQAIHELDDGHVLVLIESEVGAPGHQIDVFDPEGRFLGTLDPGLNIDPRSSLVSRGDTIYAVGLDEFGVRSLARMTLGRH